jgi:hypothetical protein
MRCRQAAPLPTCSCCISSAADVAARALGEGGTAHSTSAETRSRSRERLSAHHPSAEPSRRVPPPHEDCPFRRKPMIWARSESSVIASTQVSGEDLERDAVGPHDGCRTADGHSGRPLGAAGKAHGAGLCPVVSDQRPDFESISKSSEVRSPEPGPASTYMPRLRGAASPRPERARHCSEMRPHQSCPDNDTIPAPASVWRPFPADRRQATSQDQVAEGLSREAVGD